MFFRFSASKLQSFNNNEDSGISQKRTRYTTVHQTAKIVRNA